MSLQSTAERLSTPLDWFRRGWFSWLTQNDFALATLRHRDRRIATLACISVALALLGAVYFPVLLFALGPVVFGVAHVAADVRYLVLRRGLARWWQNAVWVGCAWLIAIRAFEELEWLRHGERLEFASAATFVAVALFAGVRERGSKARALLALFVLLGVTAAALHRPGMARLVFLHLHNLIAIAAWATLFRANKRWLVGPLGLIGVATLVLASGLAARQTLASPFASAFRLPVSTVAAWIAPFSSTRVAVGVTTAYVFLQSVHYSVWLSFIPQEEQPQRGTPTFRMSARSLFADLGTAGVLAVLLAAMAVLLGAWFDVHRARTLYLSLATFHGYLELALLAFFWVRGTNGATRRAERARVA
ncbi:MAG TPA: hypothetical protein VNW92_23990 [Polyangiaceae bacterium]|jgi:hypothetical protein|nr:hypothetical protein [Polyangiaceae bacterium]